MSTKQTKKTKKSRTAKAAAELSLLGASKGGKARAKALSPRRRKIIAKKAAIARWGSAPIRGGKRVGKKMASKKGGKRT